MLFRKRIKFIKQLDSNDCGLACLAMLLGYFGKQVSLNQLKQDAALNIEGISIQNLVRQSRKMELDLIPIQAEPELLHSGQLAFPLVAFWEQNHFIILERVSKTHVYLIDPGFGRYRMPLQEFLDGWIINHSGATDSNEANGIVLIARPTPELEARTFPPAAEKKFGLQFIRENILTRRGDSFRLLLSLLAVSVLQLIIPFGNQLIVDRGIATLDIQFIYQIALSVSILYILIAANEFIRSWNLTYISTRLNYNLVSKFLKKITSLPIKTLYSRRIGDYVERIHDHKRIEEFFSDSIIRSLFSIFSIVSYSAVLCFFSGKIFLIFLCLTVIELAWIFLFLGRIKTLDNKLFSLNAQDQDKVYEILSNLSDIKLNNLEKDKNEEWQSIQKRLFRNYLAKLKLNQIEQAGSKLFSTAQFFIITLISAMLVVKGQLSIGTMLSLLFIINQLNLPITHLINFISNSQLISNSFQRIFEIHRLTEDDNAGLEQENLIGQNITLNRVGFGYTADTPILKNISLTLPNQKITALVGFSGSGKTTLLKLLLKFYDSYGGSIQLGKTGVKLSEIKSSYWRSQCGAVLQESCIYSDTIAYNVSLQRNGAIDPDRLQQALQQACLSDFVKELPLGIYTKLHSGGATLSSGQRQRLLIARLIYKDPPIVFLDEATNALDAHTEKAILENLGTFFYKKTVLIVAHRLSTVKNADQIVVLHDGEIVEVGTHETLVDRKGNYFNLIKNQLELESEVG